MQGRPPYTNTSMHTKNPLCKSKQVKQVANVNGTLHLLTSNMSNSTIPVSYETLEKLNVKHLDKNKLELTYYYMIQESK